MATLDIVAVVLGVVSALLSAMVMTTSRRVLRLKRELISSAWRTAAILKGAERCMGEEVSEKEREVITRLVWRHSEVPLARILSNPKERDDLLRGLANPNEYRWRHRDAGDSGKTDFDQPSGSH